MEYNDLITRVQQAPVDVPDADAILGSMRRTVRRRELRRRTLLSSAFVLAVGVAMVLPLATSHGTSELTLAERVSRSLDVRPNDIPAPLLGYQHSIHNRQILTLI